jgi:hypothetical protein
MSQTAIAPFNTILEGLAAANAGWQASGLFEWQHGIV